MTSACIEENKEIVELLINAGADLGRSALISTASREGQRVVVELLISAGVALNIQENVMH